MEDAMVLNKASVERGFAHGSIYKGRVGCNNVSPMGQWSTVIRMSVSLSVCMCIPGTTLPNFSVGCLWSWLGPLMAL